MPHRAHQFAAAVPATHTAYRIIIAEDNQSLASLLTRLILRRHPTAAIQTFGNGQDALAAYDHAGAELLFVNHGMPGMDGPTMMRILRARGDRIGVHRQFLSVCGAKADQWVIAPSQAC